MGRNGLIFTVSLFNLVTLVIVSINWRSDRKNVFYCRFKFSATGYTINLHLSINKYQLL